MTDFIHCNTCYALPNASLKFFLTACGHVFCQQCGERRTENDQCIVCGQKSKVLEINGQVSSSVKEMFMDPSQLVKKQQRQVMQTLNFQQAHRSRYLKYLHQQLKKARKLQEAIENEMRKRQEAEREVHILKTRVTQLEQQLMRFSTQTPRMTPNPNKRYQTNDMNKNYGAIIPPSTIRSTVSHDYGHSLPLGVTAATYRGDTPMVVKNANRGRPMDMSYQHNSMGTPAMGFDGFGMGASSSIGSPNTIIPAGDSPYDRVWRNNMSSMTLEAKPNPTAYGSKIAAAFRHTRAP